MAEPRDPGQVVRALTVGVGRLVAGGLTGKEREDELDRVVALYADDTDVRHPFAPLGDRPLRTRAQLREHFAGTGGVAPVAERFEPVDTVVHTTGDPEVVIAEFAYAITVGGRETAVRCVFVVRVRGGEIVESRDYADHVAMARAFGRVSALADALAAAESASVSPSSPAQ